MADCAVRHVFGALGCRVHHLCSDVKDVAKVSLGLVATISALVLSLLLSAAKTAYEARGNELVQLLADSSCLIACSPIMVPRRAMPDRRFAQR